MTGQLRHVFDEDGPEEIGDERGHAEFTVTHQLPGSRIIPIYFTTRRGRVLRVPTQDPVNRRKSLHTREDRPDYRTAAATVTISILNDPGTRL